MKKYLKNIKTNKFENFILYEINDYILKYNLDIIYISLLVVSILMAILTEINLPMFILFILYFIFLGIKYLVYKIKVYRLFKDE